MFDFEKMMRLFNEVTENIENEIEAMSIVGMIIDYTASKFGGDSQEMIKNLLEVNQYVNEECGTMIV